MKTITVGNNTGASDEEHFPLLAKYEGLAPARGRTFEDAVTSLIQKNPDVFGIKIQMDPNYRRKYF